MKNQAMKVAGVKGISTYSLPHHLTGLLYGCCKIKLNPELKYMHIIKVLSAQ
jgi:hypothetical protein